MDDTRTRTPRASSSRRTRKAASSVFPVSLAYSTSTEEEDAILLPRVKTARSEVVVSSPSG